MKFEDYKLPFGYPLTLEGASAGGEPVKLASKLVGCLPGDCLITSLPRAAKASSLRAGQKILVKIMAGNGVLAFATVITQIVAQPKALVFMEYPGRLSYKEVRGATRVEIQTAISVSVEGGLEARQTDGIISDISATGARIELTEPVAEVGDAITLSGLVSVGQLKEKMRWPAMVRARIERSTREDEAKYPAIYGLEFSEMQRDQRLLLYAFVYFQLAQK